MPAAAQRSLFKASSSQEEGGLVFPMLEYSATPRCQSAWTDMGPATVQQAGSPAGAFLACC